MSKTIDELVEKVWWNGYTTPFSEPAVGKERARSQLKQAIREAIERAKPDEEAIDDLGFWSVLDYYEANLLKELGLDDAQQGSVDKDS